MKNCGGGGHVMWLSVALRSMYGVSMAYGKPGIVMACLSINIVANIDGRHAGASAAAGGSIISGGVRRGRGALLISISDSGVNRHLRRPRHQWLPAISRGGAAAWRRGESRSVA